MTDLYSVFPSGRLLLHAVYVIVPKSLESIGSPHVSRLVGLSTAALKAWRSRSVTCQESSGIPGGRRRRREGGEEGASAEEEEPAAPSRGGSTNPPRGFLTKHHAALRMREKVPRTVRAHQSSRTRAKPWKASATR